MKTFQTPDFHAELAIYCADDSTTPAEEIPLPIDQEMLSLMEAITGWVVEFEESRGSHLKRTRALRNQAIANRKQAGHGPPREIPMPEGQLVITDMSANWPAGRPTSHRGKCDRFVALLSELVSSRQQLQLDGVRFRSAIASLQSQTKSFNHSDDEIVADSFVPKHPYHTGSELKPEFELNEMVFLEMAFLEPVNPPSEHSASTAVNALSATTAVNAAKEITAAQGIDSAIRFSSATKIAPVDEAEHERASRDCSRDRSTKGIITALTTPSVSNRSSVRFDTETRLKQSCQIGGLRGFYGNRYIDWRIREDQRIELILGQIETLDTTEESSDNSEWESKLIMNPETNKYWLSVKPKGDFWLYDQETQTLQQIGSDETISHLMPSQAIVLTTTNRIRTFSRDCEGFQNINSIAAQGADGLSQGFQRWLQTDEPVLVLQTIVQD